MVMLIMRIMRGTMFNKFFRFVSFLNRILDLVYKTKVYKIIILFFLILISYIQNE